MTQKPSGIGGQDAYTVLLLVCARIAIAVGILWCYVYDARPITNGSLLLNVYDKDTITHIRLSQTVCIN